MSIDAERCRPQISDPYCEWSPIIARRPLVWPGHARLAVCICVSLEYAEWSVGPNAVPAPSLVRRPPYPIAPDVHEVSPHEYGNRVGFYRVRDLLDRFSIRTTVAMDARIATSYRPLVDACLGSSWEVIAHGLTASRIISERMSEDEERDYIRTAVTAVSRSIGKAPAGWLSIDYAESSRTPRLLREAGLSYVCDWANDEQPYLMKTSSGPLVSLPVMVELDAVFAQRSRGIAVDTLGEMIVDSFERMYRDSQDSGRLFFLNVHPWLWGHPFRIGVLRQALERITRLADLWIATGSEVADWYRAQAASTE